MYTVIRTNFFSKNVFSLLFYLFLFFPFFLFSSFFSLFLFTIKNVLIKVWHLRALCSPTKALVPNQTLFAIYYTELGT